MGRELGIWLWGVVDGVCRGVIAGIMCWYLWLRVDGGGDGNSRG